MSPELQQRVRGIFDRVLERPENDRLQFLRDICGADHEAFLAVGRMLAAHGDSLFFLDGTTPGTRRFGRYVITRELGRGAMGVVYEAADPLIGRNVAVKIILLEALAQPDEAGFLRDRLFREARSAGSLSHPGIVTIFDVGQEGEVAFIAMEYVNGPSLQQMLASGPGRDYAKALDILRQAAAALDHAHHNGVIHRDVKPANIMLHEGKTVKIADFGIAKIISNTEQTRTGVVMGTPSHMSPEQIEAKPLSGRSDQFSLATVAFRLLTGQEPFQADSVAALLHKILSGPRPSARAMNPALPAGIDKVLRRALERAPESRYPTCAEFVGALQRNFDGAPTQRNPARNRESQSLTETLTAAVEPRSRSTRWILASAAVAALIAAAVLFFFPGISRRPQTTQHAEPVKTEPPRVVAEDKPPPVAPIRPSSTDTAAPPPIDGKPVEAKPVEDKAARARQLYDQAIAFRKAKQTAKATDLFRQAATLGNIRAMAELGEALMNESDGATPDYPQALQWLRKAADAGSSSAIVSLGGMYLLGNGVDEDFEAAAQWFRKAAAAGNPAGMYYLGTMYENGQGVAEDREKAKQLFTQAAGLGNAEARRRLAELAQ